MVDHLLYLQCDDCANECPEKIPMRDFARLSIGVTPVGALHIQCVRHEKTISFMHNHEIADELFKISAGNCGCDTHKKEVTH